MLEVLCPRLSVSTLLIRGLPNEALVKTAKEQGADAIFVGRGSANDGREITVSGTVSGWMTNRAGDTDGIILQDGTEVRFPPHRGREIAGIVAEGAVVEIRGVRKKNHLHAPRITDPVSKASVEGHPNLPAACAKPPSGTRPASS
jgi:hypothetical protein